MGKLKLAMGLHKSKFRKYLTTFSYASLFEVRLIGLTSFLCSVGNISMAIFFSSLWSWKLATIASEDKRMDFPVPGIFCFDDFTEVGY